jgi:hypothetical protein
MSVDLPIQHLHEPVVSCDTALPCLVRLGMCTGDNPEIEELRRRAVLDGNTLPASRLIELVGKFGLRAECTRLDWDGLTNSERSYPVLVFLKNTNVVVVMGGDSAAAEAVSVWDPLHSEDRVLSVGREDFERAWSGDALVIARQPSTEAEASPGSATEPNIEIFDPPPEDGSDRAPLAEAQLLPGSVPLGRPAKWRRLAAIALVAAAATATGIPLWMHTVTDNPGPTEIQAKEKIPEAPRGTASTAEAAALAPDATANTASGPMPQTDPTAASPASSELPGGPAAAVAPAPTARTPEAALAITRPEPAEPPTGAAAHALTPDAAANTPSGPMPQADSRAALPAPSEPPGGPAAVVAPASITGAPEEAPLIARPGPAGPSTGPAIAAAPVVASQSLDVAAARQPADRPALAPRLSAAEITAFLTRGDILFSTGDLAAARRFYERAADAGDARAAVRLGETFDPIFLDHSHLRGVRGDAETALSWYRRARDLGAAEAEVLLNSLQAK